MLIDDKIVHTKNKIVIQVINNNGCKEDSDKNYDTGGENRRLLMPFRHLN